ncbi:MAG: hypothetical protein HWQ35_03000 [Nostoc sp. NMS1]|nr:MULTISPECIES: hypothetical protein [unclassified Nostoc]MBN3905571.1 hypothetical protein [Nostoc sp. NMS1]MBN3992455.1 hypothetical protein [Nostoc sp. NMS2]
MLAAKKEVESIWHYKQWRSAGVIEQLMNTLHEQVREQVKKSPSGRR